MYNLSAANIMLFSAFYLYSTEFYVKREVKPWQIVSS
jgi:hypothetical protein